MTQPLTTGEHRPVTVTIVGNRGPGTTCGPYTEVEVGVQVGKDCVGMTPGDVATYRYEVTVEAVGHPDGVRWRGPAVHGPTGERFLYLVWTGHLEGAPRAMFRRAKLKFTTVSPEVLAKALATGVLCATLELRMPDGSPVCATPKSLLWT